MRTLTLKRKSIIGMSKLLVMALLILNFTACKQDTPSIISENCEDTNSDLSLKAAALHYTRTVFTGGGTNEHSFRIPSIVMAPNGWLIAFAECRRQSASDWGDINLVYKISTDHGLNWGSLKELVGAGDGTWGNPTAVTDFETGRVWVFFNWNAGDKNSMDDLGVGDRRVYCSYSDNNGTTFSTRVNMTSTLQPPNWTWDAIGPGVGIQTTQANAGRLIIPARGRNIYSDDHGVTWKYKSITGGLGESTIVELPDGNLWRNDRPTTAEWDVSKRRRVAKSSDKNTLAFNAYTIHNTLYDPKCEGSMVRYTSNTPYRIYFLNPASTVDRCKMTVRISYDNGTTWPRSRRLDENDCSNGIGGYSSMTRTDNYSVGALVEKVSSSGNWSIQYHEFNLPWILEPYGGVEP